MDGPGERVCVGRLREPVATTHCPRASIYGTIKNFVSPGIFNFGPRRVTAHVYYLPLESNGLNTYPARLHCLTVEKAGEMELMAAGMFLVQAASFRCSARQADCFRPGFEFFRRSFRRGCGGRGHLRRWSGVTGLSYIGFDCIRRSDHGWFVAVALKSIMYGRSRDVIRTDCHVACHVI